MVDVMRGLCDLAADLGAYMARRPSARSDPAVLYELRARVHGSTERQLHSV